MRTDPVGGVSDSATFAQALGTLKQEGSNILLVGERSTDAQLSACHRLLGEDRRDSRYRLFVLTDDSGCSSCHDGRDGRTRTRVIRRGTENDPSSAVQADSVVGTELLGALGTEVVETVDEFEDEVDGLDPSELRVCVDSLAPLLTEHDRQNVFRFLHMLTSRIRQADGMGHFHLPVDRDHDSVRLFEPLFDAVVEVRTRNGGTEQRWHLRDQRTSSDWITL